MPSEPNSNDILDRPKDLVVLHDSELRRLNIMIGILMVVVGLILSIFHYLFLLICLLSLLAFTKREGVEISPTGMQFRRYKSYFGFRRGAWKGIPATSAIVILAMDGKKVVQRGYGFSGEVTGVFFELYIMDANHHKRVFLQVFDDGKEVSAMAKKLSTLLELPIQAFDPVPVR